MKYFANTISHLTLVMAAGCNLDCDYCLANNEKTKDMNHVHELQTATKEALLNGTYLSNILKTLEKSDNSPLQITTLELWGQEPTLLLPYLTQNFEDWAKAFPNINSISFSSNGMSGSKPIIDFGQKINQVYNHKITYGVQISYDGDWATANIRHGNPNKIKNTMLELLEHYNSQYYENIKMKFFMHNVISVDLIHYLFHNIDAILHFEDEFLDLGRQFKKFNQVDIGYGPTIQVPYKAGKKDGILITNFFKDCIKILESHGYDQFESSILKCLLQCTDVSHNNPEFFNDPINGIERITYNINDREHLNGASFYCGSNICDLKIMYDGTLVTCQAMLYDTTRESLKYTTDPFDKAIKKSCLDHHFSINLLTDTDEDINKICYLYKVGKYNVIAFALQQQLNMMIIMAKAGQIDPSYLEDKEKLLVHAFIMATRFNCQYNNLTYTGSYYMKDSGYTRMYCNGLLDLMLKYVYESKQSNINKKDKLG